MNTDYDSWMAKPTEKKYGPCIEVGDIIRYHDNSFYSIFEIINGRTALCTRISKTERRETSFGLGIATLWDVVVREDAKSTSKDRKDFCYECNTDKLTWVMMAARCSECNKIILGG